MPRLVLLLLVAVFGCKRDPLARPTPPPSVNIRYTVPLIGERFTYAITDLIELDLAVGAQTVSARETNDHVAEEVVVDVRGDTVVERTIRFIRFAHVPLGSETPLAANVVGHTYRITNRDGTRVFSGTTALAAEERQALEAYARRDTGEVLLPSLLLTNHDYVLGVPWQVPADGPAPLANGEHGGATITLERLEGSLSHFAVSQIIFLEPGGAERVPITLHGLIVMDIATSRILSIDIEGHIDERTGPVLRAKMISHQSFTYPR